MKSKKLKTCYRCGKEVKSYSYGDYCSSCAADIWDSGFESTTQHAEDIYDQEQQYIEELNKDLNKAEINYKEVCESLKYIRGRLRCAKCGYVRIRSDKLERLKDQEKTEDALKTACKKCDAIGFYQFDVV